MIMPILASGEDIDSLAPSRRDSELFSTTHCSMSGVIDQHDFRTIFGPRPLQIVPVSSVRRRKFRLQDAAGRNDRASSGSLPRAESSVYREPWPEVANRPYGKPPEP